MKIGGKHNKAKTNINYDVATPSEEKSNRRREACKRKKKKSSSFNINYVTPPKSMCWIFMDSCPETWVPSCNGNMVLETKIGML
ncbi:hypothetical protein H5410_052160 [Solanum commersonii]|uniref:Uncharacterized protein n=1 Tax=Solanum commersonii TaxID=4109 RepID=A0A9J5X272_SOLCO|nr:hypothetical protein H5410_052160 [Solanum commersonii]